MKIKIIWIVCFLISLPISALELPYRQHTCKNPLLLHDIYYGLNREVPTVYDQLTGQDAEKCGIPSDNIKEEYKKYKEIEEINTLRIYPSTYKLFYENLLSLGNFTSVTITYREDNFEHIQQLAARALEFEGINDLEELKILAETKGDAPLKGNDYILYKFPQEFFEGEHNIIEIEQEKLLNVQDIFYMGSPYGDYYDIFVNILGLDDDIDTRANLAIISTYMPKTYSLNHYFDYSVLLKCLSENGKKKNLCINHALIYNSYYKAILVAHDPIAKSFQQAINSIIDDEATQGYPSLDTIGLLESITAYDFYQYLKRGTRGFIESAYWDIEQGGKFDKENLNLKIARNYLIGSSFSSSDETYNNNLTRQDKLDYIYFTYFEKFHPESTDIIYYWEEEGELHNAYDDRVKDISIYSSLYELIEEQEVNEIQTPLFYAFIYKALTTLSMKAKADEVTKMKIRNQTYSSDDLPRVCKLYHDSLNKALQGATEEHRKAFEEKNIQVCEM